MANYYCCMRTNYFHVKDEQKFMEIMEKVQGNGDDVTVFTSKDQNGETVFGFGCYTGIYGYFENEDDYENHDRDHDPFDDFVTKLQEIVAEDDAIIMFEAGHEKLRYVVGSALVITSNDYWSGNIENFAINAAKDLLKNPKWYTCCTY